ncbi:hypothetical protein [Frigidibacter sp. MR17.24]|uniref:hypothetical protein n=1 Tax=Frigidibacter sp. MR17.24 TaxID=3127345 RepID=UPI003012ADCD
MFAFLVASAQGIDLIAQTGPKARIHNGLASEFIGLEKLLITNPDMSPDACRSIEAEMKQIEAREPPIKRYLDLICHNQVARSLGSDDIEKLSWAQRRFAHYLKGDGALQS